MLVGFVALVVCSLCFSSGEFYFSPDFTLTLSILHCNFSAMEGHRINSSFLTLWSLNFDNILKLS